MLSEAVLAELTRNSPLTPTLVELAWPSLSDESKLAVIQAWQHRHSYPDCPEWLGRLGMADASPLVRHWVARYTHFRRERPAGFMGFELFAATDEDRALTAQATADASPTVRAFVERPEFDGLSQRSALDRLLIIRHISMPKLEPFVDWLHEAHTAGVSDAELRVCAEEFFAIPRVQRDLARKQSDFLDGYDAHSSGQGMFKGWQLAHVAELGLACALAFTLPTEYGLRTMKPEELATLPHRVFETLLYRDENPVLEQLFDYVRQHPDRASPETAAALAKHDADDDRPKYSKVDSDAYRREQAAERGDQTLASVLELQSRLSELHELVKEAVQAAATRKRGIFG
jgi:hypothetical protein